MINDYPNKENGKFKKKNCVIYLLDHSYFFSLRNKIKIGEIVNVGVSVILCSFLVLSIIQSLTIFLIVRNLLVNSFYRSCVLSFILSLIVFFFRSLVGIGMMFKGKSLLSSFHYQEFLCAMVFM